MRLTRKENQDYNVMLDYLTSVTELSEVNGALCSMPMKTFAMIKVLKPVHELMHPQSSYLMEDLERLMIEIFSKRCERYIKEFEAMYKMALGYEKMNNLDDLRTIVRMMLKLKSQLGALVIRILKQLSSDWRIFFVKTLPALKKQYL